VLGAYQSVQAQTAQAHADYMATMAQVHTAFLQTSQQSIAILGQLAGGTAVVMPTIAVAPLVSAPVVSPPVVVPAVATAPVVMPTAVVHIPADVSSVVAEATLVAPAPVTALVVAAADAVMSDVELMALLLSVVADKTGYPAEMLSMEMELEGDLGIDSIKRVEILSAMQDEVPSLPEVDTAVMAELVTLGQIVEYMASQMDVSSVVAEATLAAAMSPNGAGIDRFTLEAVTAPKAGPRQRG
jgi:acyl carrier protein